MGINIDAFKQQQFLYEWNLKALVFGGGVETEEDAPRRVAMETKNIAFACFKKVLKKTEKQQYLTFGFRQTYARDLPNRHWTWQGDGFRVWRCVTGGGGDKWNK